VLQVVMDDYNPGQQQRCVHVLLCLEGKIMFHNRYLFQLCSFTGEFIRIRLSHLYLRISTRACLIPAFLRVVNQNVDLPRTDV
jgi:hypothetical protein